MTTRTVNPRLIIAATLAFAALALPPAPAHATTCGRPGGQRRAQAQGGCLQAALDKLHLSADQKAKIKPITEKTKQQLLGLKADSSLSTEQKKAKAKDILLSAFVQINPILTPAQQDQLMQMLTQARGQKNGV